MIDFFNYLADVAQTFMNYLTNVDGYFDAFFIWLQTWYIKAKLSVSIVFLRTSYLVAIGLLNEIGFNALFSDLFNMLPSELRFYAFAFKIPEGVSIWMNCATTALVMRLSR